MVCHQDSPINSGDGGGCWLGRGNGALADNVWEGLAGCPIAVSMLLEHHHGLTGWDCWAGGAGLVWLFLEGF